MRQIKPLSERKSSEFSIYKFLKSSLKSAHTHRNGTFSISACQTQEEGPKILPIGSGDRESEMMAYLTKVGFKGQIGILGHIEEEDVAIVLQQNLSGLQRILSSIGDNEALSTYGKN